MSGISSPVQYVINTPVDVGLDHKLTDIDNTTLWADEDTWDDSEVWGEN